MFLNDIFSKFGKGLFGASSRNGDASKSAAKSRLQFVLVQDRAGLSSEEMGKFKKELMGVIEKYFKVEKDRFDITYKREGDLTKLLINSPVTIRRGGNNNNQKQGQKSSVSGTPAPAANA